MKRNKVEEKEMRLLETLCDSSVQIIFGTFVSEYLNVSELLLMCLLLIYKLFWCFFVLNLF